MKLATLLLFAGALHGQTVVAGPWTFKAPITGANGLTSALPATCTVAQTYFATDATAGANLYLCTATNQWTQLSSGAPVVSATINASAAITAQNYFEATISTGVSLNGGYRFSGLGVREATQFTFTPGIVGLNITAGGSGFSGGPHALSFANCTGCAGTYTIAGGQVSSYTISNFGSTATSPTVTFPLGGGTGATATVLQITSLIFSVGRPGVSTHSEVLPSFALASASAPESGTFIVPSPPLYVAATTYTLVGTLIPTCTGGYTGANCWIGSGSVSFLTAGSVITDLTYYNSGH